MQLIETVIQQPKLDALRQILDELGVDEFMESPVICHSQHKGQPLRFRGATFMAGIVEKVKLEIVAADDAASSIIAAIKGIVQTDECRIAMRPYLEAT